MIQGWWRIDQGFVPRIAFLWRICLVDRVVFICLNFFYYFLLFDGLAFQRVLGFNLLNTFFIAFSYAIFSYYCCCCFCCNSLKDCDKYILVNEYTTYSYLFRKFRYFLFMPTTNHYNYYIHSQLLGERTIGL